MEIGGDASFSLSLCNTASELQVEALASAALAVVLGAAREDAALVGPAFEELEVDLIKRVYSALVCLFLEAAKNDFSPSDLSSFLRAQCRLSDPKRAILCRVFQEHKEDLRGLLSLTANHTCLPQLVGVDWSLDYCVSSSEDRALKEFVYSVSFKTKDGTSEKDDDVKFLCSVEGLQDMLSRLKDAYRSVERAVNRH